MAGAPIEVSSKCTDAEGSFSFDDLRADSYVVSLSLPFEKYWSTFVDHVFGGEAYNKDSNGQENEKGNLINILLLPENGKRDHPIALKCYL